jgi:glycosyl transferase family 25
MTQTWPIYLINMRDNTERLARSKAEFDRAGLHFNRIDAVNGWALSPKETARVYDVQANRKRGKRALVGPELGCYLSHIETWRKIAVCDAPGGIIFEDDFRVLPDTDLGRVLNAVSNDYDRDNDWDIAKLYALRPVKAIMHSRNLTDGYQMITPRSVPSTTLCYAIRKDTAARLIDQAIPFFRPIDEDHKFFWEFGITVTLVQPAPVDIGDQDAQTGTIGAFRKARKRQGDVPAWLQAWRNLRYRIGYERGLRRAWKTP